MSQPRATAAETPSTYRPLVVALAAAAAGVVLDRTTGWPLWVWWPVGAIACASWWTLWRRERTWWAVWPLLAAVAATGASWHHCRWSLFAADQVVLAAPADAGPAALEAIAVSGPRRVPAASGGELQPLVTPERTRLEIEVVALRDRDTWRTASGRMSLTVDGHLRDLRRGDRLRIFGQWGVYQGPANPGEFDFARRARAARRLCWLRCEFPECITAQRGGSSIDPAGVVDFLRTEGDELLWRNLGPAQRGLAAAMFLGARDELDPDVAQAFVETGTIHLLVVSGLNVGILAGFLFLIMRVGFVPRRWALAIVVVAAVLYAAVTDAQPPVVRATVMVLVGCLGMVLSRQPLGFNTLAAAGIVVLAINPAELFEAGTQLSFLAVGVLVYFAGAWGGRRQNVDPLERLIAATRPWPVRVARGLLGRTWQAVVVTTAIWLVVCPLIMARFHLVSPAAIVLGPLLAIPVTLAMGSAFGIFLFGWLVPPLGTLLGLVCGASLAVLQGSVEWARQWPLSHAWVVGPGDWWLIGFYAALAVWALVPRWRPPRRWSAAIACGWAAVGFLVALLPARGGDALECTFLSVGHGTAVVVELPDGQTLLYDAGRLGPPQGASRVVAGFLWSRSITHLDAIVISHADVDHYNAVPALLDQFSAGAVYVSPVMFERPSRALDALRAAIDKHQVPLREIWSGDRLRADPNTRIEVLHPPRGGVLGSDNANSIVLAIEHGGRRLLLSGDLESPGLDDVLAELPYDCDAVMAPHHGSAASDPPGFAAWSRPEWTVISGGRADRTRDVQAAYEERGSRVLHTAEHGAVSVMFAGDELSVECWREVREHR